MKKITNLSIGSDIETFLQNTQTKEVVSAEGLVKGTKHEPFNFDKNNKYYATSLDNVLAEFCIPPVKVDSDLSCVESFSEAIEKSLSFIKQTLPPDLNVLHVASAVLNDKWLQTENSQLFGCESDYCVWTRTTNPKPEADKNLRSAGFHVHFGYDNPDLEITEEIVKAMDLFLGVPSVIIDPDTRRRELYGKAGAFRIKEYGGEYRTLSGYFLSSKELISWVFENTVNAIGFVNNNKNISDELGLLIQKAINTNNNSLAKEIIKNNNILIP